MGVLHEPTRSLESLEPGRYRVVIDSTLSPGLAHLRGGDDPRQAPNDEFILSTYICHPALANDNLSGVVLLWALAKTLLARQDLRYTYRLLWSPGTLGPLCWLDRNRGTIDRVKHGLAVSCVGDRRAAPVQAKQARRHDDRSCGCQRALRLHGKYRRRLEPLAGATSGQFCSPGFDLAGRHILAHASRALPRVSLERRQPRSRHSARARRELPNHPEDHRCRRDERHVRQSAHRTASPSSAGAASTRRYPTRGMSTPRCSGCSASRMVRPTCSRSPNARGCRSTRFGRLRWRSSVRSCSGWSRWDDPAIPRQTGSLVRLDGARHDARGVIGDATQSRSRLVGDGRARRPANVCAGAPRA